MDNTIVKKTIDEAVEIVKENKNAIAASAIAYYFSKTNKERNAIIAGVLAFAFLGDKDEDKK